MFRKAQVPHSEWIMDIGGRSIPLLAIKSFIQLIFTVAIVAMGFLMGYQFAYDQIAMTAYLSQGTICDASGFNCMTCTAINDAGKVRWNCKDHEPLDWTNTPMPNTTMTTNQTF